MDQTYKNSTDQKLFDQVSKTIPEGLDLSDMKAFLTRPIPQGRTLQCFVLVKRKGLSGQIHPTYEMYLEGPDIYLLSGRMGWGRTSYYTIGMDKTNFDKGDNVLANLRSNFWGTEFVLYENGTKDKEIKIDTKDKEENKKIKKDDLDGFFGNELGAFHYKAALGKKGQRDMTIALPALEASEDGKDVPTKWPSSGIYSTILKAYRDNQMMSLYILRSKLAKFNAELGCYLLDFKNRVRLPSEKNCQMVNEADKDTIILQFGEFTVERYSLDFQYPFSPLQAFAYSLSSCDYKLACA